MSYLYLWKKGTSLSLNAKGHREESEYLQYLIVVLVMREEKVNIIQWGIWGNQIIFQIFQRSVFLMCLSFVNISTVVIYLTQYLH